MVVRRSPVAARRSPRTRLHPLHHLRPAAGRLHAPQVAARGGHRPAFRAWMCLRGCQPCACGRSSQCGGSAPIGPRPATRSDVALACFWGALPPGPPPSMRSACTATTTRPKRLHCTPSPCYILPLTPHTTNKIYPTPRPGMVPTLPGLFHFPRRHPPIRPDVPSTEHLPRPLRLRPARIAATVTPRAADYGQPCVAPVSSPAPAAALR